MKNKRGNVVDVRERGVIVKKEAPVYKKACNKSELIAHKMAKVLKEAYEAIPSDQICRAKIVISKPYGNSVQCKVAGEKSVAVKLSKEEKRKILRFRGLSDDQVEAKIDTVSDLTLDDILLGLKCLQNEDITFREHFQVTTETEPENEKNQGRRKKKWIIVEMKYHGL